MENVARDGGSGMSSETSMMMSETGGVRVEREGPILTVTLANPENLNAQTPATWRRLSAIESEAGPDVRVVLLVAEGPSFGAGLDRRMLSPDGVPGEESLASLAGMTDDHIDGFIRGAQSAFTWWSRTDAITIAAVQGHAIGASAQLALACDIMLVADDLKFALRETSLGLVPDLAGTWPLVRRVGYSRALDICGTGRFVGAAESVAIGLAHSAHPVDALASAQRALADAFLNAPASSLRALKPLLQDAADRNRVDQEAAERAAQIPRLREIRGSGAPR
jgi:enoyl-CoA hydratase/carnithine racemase